MNKALILDFGSQYTQLIARKVRELGVYSEIHPFNTPLKKIKSLAPGAIIFSGGPRSVYEPDSPHPDPGIFNLGIPILGICYGLQLIAYHLGGQVLKAPQREYGFAALHILDRSGLLHGLKEKTQVWMSHGDRLETIPEGFIITARTANSRAAVIENPARKIYGVQFHPEVAHTREGKKLLGNFLFRLAGLRTDWNMSSFIEDKVKEIRQQVGKEKVICGLSGGIDSLVTSLLIQKAIGRQLHCVFVNNGLLRRGEYQTQLEEFRRQFSLQVIGVEAEDRFLEKLKGVTSPEKKRKIIGQVFIEIFEEEARKLGQVKFLAQGTIYPDLIESTSVKGPSHTIKSHHNVGGLPEKFNFQLVEPLRELFKDEVRALALELGVSREFIHQHPFPGPGLAVRIIGEVNRENLRLLREADAILLEEVRKARIYHKLWQAFAVLLPVRSVGVMGDQRTYQQVVAIRLVQSTDGMTANWYQASPRLLKKISTRIVNEVDGVNRVVYDITSKPPGTIEWE
ncbi:MAG: glutamine-hydrolyzing GMP synthase [Candidatus Aminicenantes bacterium]|nr:glutamine-hydrolyzing GMP synthase [Candidatus Aminicenantes bacterium]